MRAIVPSGPSSTNYYVYNPNKRLEARKESATSPSHSPTSSRNESPSKIHANTTIEELFEPAVDGPPSPERLRQLNKQMKRSSHLNRPPGHRSVSSSSSSLLSISGDRSDRPNWENALENVTLTRWPTNRSAGSSTTSRERHESVQVFGKNLFGGMAKSKRESTANSSSSGSMYSTDLPLDNVPVVSKEGTLVPTLFNRRKPSRDDSAQRRLQISGPFNFQHVSHHERDQSVPTQPPSNIDGGAGPNRTPTSAPASVFGQVRGAGAFNARFSSLSPDSTPLQMDGRQSVVNGRPSLVPRHTAPASTGPRRLVKHARSQDYLRTSPPRQVPVRPPRPLMETPAPNFSGPVPPPRVSSRQSMRLDGWDSFAATSLERPQTSGGFRRPQPFNPMDSPELPLPPATSYGYIPPVEDTQSLSVNDHRFSHALTTPGDAAWPLIAGSPQQGYETPLEDVPEEEEQHGISRKSHLSMTSTRSSLRGSQSAPLLRSLAQSQRPMSGASETLGHLDYFPVKSAVRGQQEQEDRAIRESWEDDIDYCYEHEAEANCDYQWERTSLDVQGNSGTPPHAAASPDDQPAEAKPVSTTQSSPGAASPRPDAPAALALATPASSTSPSPAAMAPNPAPPVTNNFSFPRGDRRSHRPSMMKFHRPMSVASSFKESHGFTLSPSLLIPGDYHQQMLLTETEKQEHLQEEELVHPGHQHPFLEAVSMPLQKSPLMNEQRSSISTTGSNSSSHSDSTGERHVSGNSTWTSLSRLTTSTTSLNKLAERSPIDIAPEPLQASDVVEEPVPEDKAQDAEEETTPPATKDNDTVPELIPFPTTSFARKPYHKSHASESVARDEISSLKSPYANKMRRPRARTTSLSAQAPPVGQYALFPKTFIKATGDRI